MAGGRAVDGAWRSRLDAALRRATNFWVVRHALAVLGIANQSGAPLLAAALAFNAMFAILPGLLLLSGILGWAIEDVELRARLLADLLARIPALGPAMSDSLEGIVRERGGLTLIGVIGLVWGASNFYGVLDEVMRRIFAGGAVRGFIEQRVRGFLTVVGLIVLTFGVIVFGGLATFVITTVGEVPGVAIVLSVAGPLAFIGFSIVAVLFTYLFVPTAPPSVRAAWLPALVAGTGIGLLTSLFTLVAPLLVGGLAAFGVLAAVFGALVWLNLGFQMLLWGAAWARYRRDRVRLSAFTADI